MEDSSLHSGIKFIAACNGTTAGGGYELALACDEIVLVDDRSSAVSLPEVPLLGVLPGTGGLTRLSDKRRVRHDHADVFCTTAEGVRGQRAVDWKLVDALAKPGQFAEVVRERALALGRTSTRAGAKAVALAPLARTYTGDRLDYEWGKVPIDRARRSATLTVRCPGTDAPRDLAAIEAAGALWWPLAMAGEPHDAAPTLRTNQLGIRTRVLHTHGEAAAVPACAAARLAHPATA